MDLVTITVVTFLGAWLLATIVNVIPGGDSILRHLGVPALFVPTWNFFAPTPGVHDFRFLVRDQWPGGRLGPWREVPGLDTPRGWVAAFWNPQKIFKKAVFDAATNLVKKYPAATRSGAEMEAVKLSIPYLACLHHVSCLPRHTPAVATQFVLVRTSRVDGTHEVYLLSELHPLVPEETPGSASSAWTAAPLLNGFGGASAHHNGATTSDIPAEVGDRS